MVSTPVVSGVAAPPRRGLRLTVVAAAAVAAAACLAAPAGAAQVLIDFGTASTGTTTDAVGRTWTNITEANDTSGSPHALLSTTTGTATGYTLAVSNPAGVTNAVGFNSNNTNGTTAPTGTAAARNYPASATRDTLYGNTVLFGTATVQAVRLTLSNLLPTEQYSFDFFASRIGAGGDNRESEYRITGGPLGTAATSVLLNASENTGTVAGAAGFRPDASGQIVIELDPGPANNNASGFFYLGVLEINSSPVPEPTAASFPGIAATAGLLARRRQRRR